MRIWEALEAPYMLIFPYKLILSIDTPDLKAVCLSDWFCESWGSQFWLL